MKRFLQKNGWILILTVILAALLLFCLRSAEPQTVTLSFQVETQAGVREIFPVETQTGSWYVFLPAHTSLEQVKIRLPAGETADLNGTPLSDGMDCGGFAPETAYALTVNGREAGNLQFFCSANVAALYIDTATGTMDRIHEDKSYRESAAVTLLTADGSVDYTYGACTIKGRGNASWGRDKKPYGLILPEAGDLLGMGAAENWVLLANAADPSNLNNTLVLDLAARAGLDWVPECRYVDVYLNGSYNGLYLLTEKVEVGDNRLDIDANAGDFLCKIDLESRWDTLNQPFLTPSGRTVEITWPEAAAASEISPIQSLVSGLEETILSGTDLSAVADFDLDSWIRRYLIDEISGNIDSDLASSYFYCQDGVFYAGPVWDYDMIFGNCYRNGNPRAFIAVGTHEYYSSPSPYYRALYANESIYSRMVEIYQREFLPLLEELLDGGVQQLSDTIAAASRMNSLRWEAMFQYQQVSEPLMETSTRTVLDYLRARVEFLNSAWIGGVDYCTVQFALEEEGTFWNISVERGGVADISELDMEGRVWLDAQTGAVFDAAAPVREDQILVLQREDTSQEGQDSVTKREILTVLSIFVLIIMFLCLTAVDFRRRKQERSGDRERSGTRLSP